MAKVKRAVLEVKENAYSNLIELFSGWRVDVVKLENGEICCCRQLLVQGLSMRVQMKHLRFMRNIKNFSKNNNGSTGLKKVS